MTSEQAPGDPQATTYAYDPAANRRTATDASGPVTTEYNEIGAVVRSVDSFGSELAPVYDLEENVLTSQVAVGAITPGPSYTTTYVYDDANRLSSLTDPAGRQYTFLYDKRDNLRATQYPNDTFSWSAVNPAGWQTQLVHRHGSLGGSLPTSPPADGSPITDLDYEYFGNGQRSSEERSGEGLTTETTSYMYDAIGRLSELILPDGTVRDYVYDRDSNRTAVKENSTTVETYTYDPAQTPGVDQLTSVTRGTQTTTFTYNTDGDATARGGDTLTWNGWGRHTGGSFSGQAVSYTFDSLGFRRQRIFDGVTTRFVQGGLMETNTSGTLQVFDVSGPQGDLAHYLGAPSTGTSVSYLYFNAHGDLAAQADTAGTRTADHSYDPFGSLLSGTAPTNALSERFTGRWDKKLDTTTGLVEMGARPYDPGIGRFYAVDPVEGGSLNVYDYATQDPIDVYDLDGTKSRCVVVCLLLGASGKKALEDWFKKRILGKVVDGSLGTNPFKGKSAQEIARILTKKGYVPRGPDPVRGRGSFLNPRTGRSYHVDATHGPPKGPHVGVTRPRGFRDVLPPRDYAI
jgi:RHS repeat-associated protein